MTSVRYTSAECIGSGIFLHFFLVRGWSIFSLRSFVGDRIDMNNVLQQSSGYAGLGSTVYIMGRVSNDFVIGVLPEGFLGSAPAFLRMYAPSPSLKMFFHSSFIIDQSVRYVCGPEITNMMFPLPVTYHEYDSLAYFFFLASFLTLLGPQSRFGDKLLII